MTVLLSLWLPILLSAVLVFVASSLLLMVLGYHAADWQKLPEEDAVQEALRRVQIASSSGSARASSSPGPGRR
jgi:hypothetical protein